MLIISERPIPRYIAHVLDPWSKNEVVHSPVAVGIEFLFDDDCCTYVGLILFMGTRLPLLLLLLFHVTHLLGAILNQYP